MSNKEALDIFIRKHVTTEMVDYLVTVTQSIINVKTPTEKYPSPPTTPGKYETEKKPVSLKSFIINLIRYSNVQVPTLMATLVYLNRLKQILPSDQIYGIETTHHRIFVGCLILTAKYINDSSPLNKHWARYSSGLLSVKELNVIEVEVLSYLDWDLNITDEDLYESFQPFLIPIKTKLRMKEQEEFLKKQKVHEKNKLSLLSKKPSMKSLKKSTSFSSIKKMLNPPPSASSVSSYNSLTPTSAMSSSSSISSISSEVSPIRMEKSHSSVPSLTNSASTYSSSGRSSAYSLSNSSSSSIQKPLEQDDDFSFVEPPTKAITVGKSYSPMYLDASGNKSIFSPKNLLAKLSSRNSSPKMASPQLYRIDSNISTKSGSSTRLLSPIANLKNKFSFNKKTLSENTNVKESETTIADLMALENIKSSSVTCLEQPAMIHKSTVKHSVSSNNLRHFSSVRTIV